MRSKLAIIFTATLIGCMSAKPTGETFPPKTKIICPSNLSYKKFVRCLGKVAAQAEAREKADFTFKKGKRYREGDFIIQEWIVKRHDLPGTISSKHYKPRIFKRFIVPAGAGALSALVLVLILL